MNDDDFHDLNIVSAFAVYFPSFFDFFSAVVLFCWPFAQGRTDISVCNQRIEPVLIVHV